MVRADEMLGPENIEDIWMGICQACLIIADITNLNANVFYEIGISHALGKKVILLTQNLKRLPFDVRNYRFIEYKNNIDGAEMLKSGLKKYLDNVCDL